jgi:hypothetical protein
LRHDLGARRSSHAGPAALYAATPMAQGMVGSTRRWPAQTALGGVDGFEEDEAEGEGDKGAVVLGRLLAAELHALEAFEFPGKLLDAGAGPIERLREEARPVLGR